MSQRAADSFEQNICPTRGTQFQYYVIYEIRR